MVEKYGFIYIWHDRKKSKKYPVGRYYIGCHWGNINDGYICSSNWMRNEYRKRPKDFKNTRKILKYVYERESLLIEEYKWLKLIKEKDLGKKYYNLRNVLFPASKDQYPNRKGKTFDEFFGESKSKEIKEKLSKSLTGKTKTKTHLNNIKKSLDKYWQLPENKQKCSERSREIMSRPEIKQKLSEQKLGERNPQFGKAPSSKTRKKLSKAMKEAHINGKRDNIEIGKKIK